MIKVIMVVLLLLGNPAAARTPSGHESLKPEEKQGILACIEQSAAEELNARRSDGTDMFLFLIRMFQSERCKRLWVSEEDWRSLNRSVANPETFGVIEFVFGSGTAWVPYPFIPLQPKKSERAP